MLAFDRARVDALRRMLDAALGDLDAAASVGAASPELASAAGTATAARRRLAPWLDRLRGLSTCAVMEGYRPIAPDPSDLEHAHLLALASLPGWSFSTDPAAGPGSGARGLRGAESLGHQLAQGDRLDELLDGDGVDVLARRAAEIARSTEESEHFLHELGTAGLLRLVDALGRRLQDAELSAAGRTPGADRAPVTRLERTLVLLGEVVAAAGQIGTAVAVARHGDPHGAAVFLRGAELRGGALGLAVAEILVRWSRGGRPWWIDRTTSPATVAERLVPLLAGDPEASGVAVERLVLDGAVFVLMFGARDPHLAFTVVHAATDPATTDERRAGVRLLGLLDALRDMVADPDFVEASRLDWSVVNQWHAVRAALGAVVAPWQLHLSLLAPRWGRRPVDTIGHLVWVADDPRSATALAEGLGLAVALAATGLPHARDERRQVVDDIAGAIGASAEVLRDAEIDEWSERKAQIAAVALLADRVPLVSHPLAKLAKGIGLKLLASRLAGDGDEVADTALWAEQDRLALMASLLASALLVEAVAAGRIDPFSLELDEDDALELQHTADAVSNAAGRGDALAAAASN